MSKVRVLSAFMLHTDIGKSFKGLPLSFSDVKLAQTLCGNSISVSDTVRSSSFSLERSLWNQPREVEDERLEQMRNGNSVYTSRKLFKDVLFTREVKSSLLHGMLTQLVCERQFGQEISCPNYCPVPRGRRAVVIPILN